MPGETLLSVRGLVKRFPGVVALDDLSLEVRAGEITAVLGHNGSGKSTLVKVLAGMYSPDEGGISQAEGTGLHFIHQDLGLIHELSTVENLALLDGEGTAALAPLRRAGAEATRERLELFGAGFDVMAPVGTLTPAQRAIVAIARALAGWTNDRNVLVLDEPTEALHHDEVDVLFSAVRKVAERGAGVIFISHRLDEALRLAHRVIVLRDGCKVVDVPRAEIDQERLVAAVAGRPAGRDGEAPDAAGPDDRRARGGTPVLRVRGLRGRLVRDLDLSVLPGEVVGVAGALGSGREEVCSLLFGATPGEAAVFELDGRSRAPAGPSESIAAGLAFVPGDRTGLGAVMGFNARENLTLPRLRPLRRLFGSLDARRERAEAARMVRAFDVRPADPERPLSMLSGGNQQKVVMAKWLRNEPKVLLLEEPTQGVDIATKTAIYDTVADAARRGAAVIVCSSDARELTSLCHRVHVLSKGQVVEELTGDAITEAGVVRASYETADPTAKTPIGGAAHARPA